METHTAIRKENAKPGVSHVRFVEKRIIGQRCAPTKMKTRKESPKHVGHTILNNRMRFRIKAQQLNLSDEPRHKRAEQVIQRVRIVEV